MRTAGWGATGTTVNSCGGQLGHGDGEDRWAARRIAALARVRVGGTAAGHQHTLLLSTNSAVYS